MRNRKNRRGIQVALSFSALCWGGFWPLGASAQPEIIDPGDVTDMVTGDSPTQRASKAWKALREGMKEADAKEPAKALAAYIEFSQAHPRMNADLGVQVSLAIALRHEDLADTGQALQTYDAALKTYGAQPEVALLLNSKARFLRRQKREADAVAMLEEWWPRVSGSYAHLAQPVLHIHSDLLGQLKRPDERVRVLRRGMVEFPRLLDGRTTNYEWVYTTLMQTLSEEKREAEALSWAKLRFMVSPYESEPLARSTRLLAKTWSAAEPERAGLKAFGIAQKEAGAPNPLREVALPVLEPELLESLKGRFDKSQALDERNIWRILSGTPESLVAAMGESRALCDSPDKAKATQGALEVCRVFKATDLHLRRSTAFLRFLKAREGEDPTKAFIAEQGKPAI